jgi:hypothetical protein
MRILLSLAVLRTRRQQVAELARAVRGTGTEAVQRAARQQ